MYVALHVMLDVCYRFLKCSAPCAFSGTVHGAPSTCRQRVMMRKAGRYRRGIRWSLTDKAPQGVLLTVGVAPYSFSLMSRYPVRHGSSFMFRMPIAGSGLQHVFGGDHRCGRYRNARRVSRFTLAFVVLRSSAHRVDDHRGTGIAIQRSIFAVAVFAVFYISAARRQIGLLLFQRLPDQQQCCVVFVVI